MTHIYSDDDDDYEDDFEDAKSTSRRPSASSRTREKSPPYSNYSTRSHRERRRSRTRSPISRSPSPVFKKTKRKYSRQNSVASTSRSAYAASSRAPGNGRKPPKKGSNSSMSRTTGSTKIDNQIVQRILSAGRTKVHKLQNIVEELSKEVEELQMQNKDLKRTQHKQERELVKIEHEEANLPTLLHRHSAEVKALRERLKKSQEVLRVKERDVKHQDSEIIKLREKVKTYEELSRDKKLKERAELAKRLSNLEKELEEKNKKVEDLEKTIRLTDKTRIREIRAQKEKYKHAQESLVKLENEQHQLTAILKEKGKELDRRNIYHQNFVRMKKIHPTEIQQPALLPARSADRSHTSEKPVVEPAKNSRRTPVFLTAAQSDTSSVTQREIQDTSLDEQDGGEVLNDSFQDDSLEKERWKEAIRQEVEEEVRKRKEEEERRKMDEERRKRDADEARRKLEEDVARERAKFEEERQQRETENRRREELERIRQEEERKRLLELKKEEDEQEAGMRRKKEQLLSRLRAIDDNQSNKKSSSLNFLEEDLTQPQVIGKPKEKQLPIFLQNTKTDSKTHSTKTESDGDHSSRHSSARDYNFKQSVENLHKGLPAFPSNDNIIKTEDDVSFGSYQPSVERKAPTKRLSRRGEVSFGSYNPSFGSDEDSKEKKDSGLVFGTGVKQNTKENKDDLVFGNYNPSFSGSSDKTDNKHNEEDIFGSPNRNAANRRRPRVSGGVFGDDFFSGTDSKSGSSKGNSLFSDEMFGSSKPKKISGSGFGGLDDDSGLLPRRKRIQAEKNVPAVGNALNDTIEDELEEVIL